MPALMPPDPPPYPEVVDVERWTIGINGPRAIQRVTCALVEVVERNRKGFVLVGFRNVAAPYRFSLGHGRCVEPRMRDWRLPAPELEELRELARVHGVRWSPEHAPQGVGAV